jgi:ABC-type polysaccharide/polyol phosphate transport system ATPase subunit
MSEPVIALDGVWQEFRPRTAHGNRRRGAPPVNALRNVTFRIEHGESVGIVGHNGSGKTTLLRTLAGVLEPSQGTCQINGRVSSLLDLTAGLNRDLSGNENIMVGGVLLGMSRRQVRQEYDAIAAFSGLDDSVLNQPLSAYSAGMTLRIAFSVLTRTDASVLLVDEVLAVGDEEFQERALEWIQDFSRTGLVVMASHDLELMGTFCSRLLVIEAGCIVFDGDPEQALALYEELRQAGAAQDAADAPAQPSPSRQRWWGRGFLPTGARRARQ